MDTQPSYKDHHLNGGTIVEMTDDIGKVREDPDREDYQGEPKGNESPKNSFAFLHRLFKAMNWFS